mmetsp:Transcript_1832/g.2361  ORF Transcript_1832/g.2361 Transcript_1832/m.2361 type:complete len:326 (-) Transcript_1832:1215-2192(-)|eukprot:CAMPEP_0204830548 /NCGR_PEP_ID=MMETSP1346-20131115/8821_1 /ASSEMBLY_ACC=CAM_ASM_000771 /TAXON_ID=215587 /ORGANISM="Aplanochytrium stocchinoi, Strain GSBS06" /LENGTH=325 /DNA_ID=CAMNT_0051960907 /DNA_START=467 /DNA_END=1444 /DNA_ORIENTATION=-
MFQQFESLFVSSKADIDREDENAKAEGSGSGFFSKLINQYQEEEDAKIELLPCTKLEDLPPLTEWKSKPILLKETKAHENATTNIPINGIPFNFETSCFAGKLLFRSHTMPEAEAYFKGKKRLSSMVISGKFKKPLNFKDVQTGQEFPQPVKKPPSIVYKPAIAFFKMLAPLLRIFVGCEQFYSMSPLMQTVQSICISDEEMELSPDMVVEENYGEVVLGKRMTGVERKKYFSDAENLNGRMFDTEKWYTLDFYNDKVDVEKLCLKVLGSEFLLSNYVNHQPLRILSRVFEPGDPRDLYLWNFEIWHESLLKQTGKDESETEEGE